MEFTPFVEEEDEEPKYHTFVYEEEFEDESLAYSGREFKEYPDQDDYDITPWDPRGDYFFPLQ